MILDTNILIEILGNNIKILEKLEKLGERVSTTSITKYELFKSPDEDQIRAILSNIVIYDFDSISAERSGNIFKALKKKGKMINELDILIASIAIAHDELLVTMDNDFKNVEQLKLLVL